MTLDNKKLIKPWEAPGNASEATDEDCNEGAKEEDGEESDREKEPLPSISVDGGHRQMEAQEEGQHHQGGHEARCCLEPKNPIIISFCGKDLPVSHSCIDEWHSDSGNHAGDHLNIFNI